jgi:hypothetical protein
MLREPTIFLLHGFLSAEECAAHVARGEALGFEEASLGLEGVFREYRDNDRAILDDTALAAALYERARPHLVQEWMMRRVSGFGERWRYYRYAPGQKFKVHGDGSVRLPGGEESQFTFLIYLNDEGVEGGSTNFHLSSGGEVLKVRPRAGTALVFMHKHLHEGAEVTAGVKYVLRTDVMYSPVGRPA